MIRKFFPLLIVAVFLLLGCNGVGTGDKTGEKVTKIKSYGLSAEIYSFSREFLYPGEPFTINVRIYNHGDKKALLKRVYILGSVLSIEGNTVFDVGRLIYPRGLDIVTFDLKVSSLPGSDVLTFWPAICYNYTTEGQFSIYATADNNVYDSMKQKYHSITLEQTLAPIMFTVKGEPIVLLKEVDFSGGKVYYGIAPLRIYYTSESSNGWPVSNCDDISEANLSAELFFDEDPNIIVVPYERGISCDFEKLLELVEKLEDNNKKNNFIRWFFDYKLTYYALSKLSQWVEEEKDSVVEEDLKNLDNCLNAFKYRISLEKKIIESVNETGIKEFYSGLTDNYALQIGGEYVKRIGKSRDKILTILVISKDYVTTASASFAFSSSYSYYRYFPESTIRINIKS